MTLRDQIKAAYNSGKRTKEEVHYSKGKPDARCGLCQHFKLETKSCELVAGTIAPQMWCELFDHY